MTTYYFTFGVDHKHPVTNKAMLGYWVQVEAESTNRAREVMVKEFGDAWGYQYHEAAFMKVAKYCPKGLFASFD